MIVVEQILVLRDTSQAQAEHHLFLDPNVSELSETRGQSSSLATMFLYSWNSKDATKVEVSRRTPPKHPMMHEEE